MNKNTPITRTFSVFKQILTILAITSLVGCASTIGSSNFHDRIKIEREDVSYYLGKYIGTEKGCFPPITQRICKRQFENEVLYSTTKKLEMESFKLNINVITPQTEGTADQIKDFLYLAASDLALQRGYTMFTVLNRRIFWLCQAGTEVNTSGVISPGFYGQSTAMATSTISSTNNCSGTQTLKVLFFRDKNDLALGVLKMEHSGILASTSAWPLIDLYYGSVPGLKARNDIVNSGIIDINDINESAWKVHYDAQLLSKDLRNKYQVTNTSPYTFVEMSETNAKINEKDVINARKIVSPQ